MDPILQTLLTVLMITIFAMLISAAVVALAFRRNTQEWFQVARIITVLWNPIIVLIGLALCTGGLSIIFGLALLWFWANVYEDIYQKLGEFTGSAKGRTWLYALVTCGSNNRVPYLRRMPREVRTNNTVDLWLKRPYY